MHIRNEVGCTKGLSNLQVYMKFKLCLMDLLDSMRPKESSWPSVFLDVFIPELANLSTLSKPQRVEYIRNGMKRMHIYLLEMGYEIRIIDDDREYAKSCSESEECSEDKSQPSCVEEEEETCCGEDSIF